MNIIKEFIDKYEEKSGNPYEFEMDLKALEKEEYVKGFEDGYERALKENGISKTTAKKPTAWQEYADEISERVKNIILDSENKMEQIDVNMTLFPYELRIKYTISGERS